MDTEPIVKPTREIEIQIPEGGLFKFYANNLQMASTAFDIRVLFGRVAGATETKVLIDQRVEITMTWLEAKVLADFLNTNIKAFEDLNGPLKLPKNLDKIIAPDTFGDSKNRPIDSL